MSTVRKSTVRKSARTALLLALASAAPAQGWKRLEAQTAPDIFAKVWKNTGDQVPSNQALQGKVWILKFFATW